MEDGTLGEVRRVLDHGLVPHRPIMIPAAGQLGEAAVLMNQCPHNLDLFNGFGLPKRLYAMVH